MTQQGFLIISDITGYSKYVNESELEHARDSLTALLNLLLDHTKSPLVLSKLEGKARGAWIMCKISDLLQKMIFVSQNDKGYEKLRQRMQQDLADGTAIVSPAHPSGQGSSCFACKSGVYP